jgi:hypothetical protein
MNAKFSRQLGFRALSLFSGRPYGTDEANDWWLPHDLLFAKLKALGIVSRATAT